MTDPNQPPEPGETPPYGVPQQPPAPYGQPYYQQYPAPYGAPSPMAPYGVDPLTGYPYSDKSKVVAGVLQIVLPFGVGRFYSGHVGLGVAQLLVTLVTCGMGALWPFIDGILLLVGHPTDPQGRPLRS